MDQNEHLEERPCLKKKKKREKEKNSELAAIIVQG